MLIDLYIKNAKDLNDEVFEVAVAQGKIVEVGKNLEVEAKKVLDLEGKYMMSSGWIDGHVHANKNMNLYYDEPDEIGVKQGVTSIIDAGSTGADNIGDFYQETKNAKTNVYALINISEKGIIHQDELSDLKKINKNKVLKVLKEYPDFILGLKARMSESVVGDNNIEPLLLAKRIQKETDGLPLMVHIGSAPPELDEILYKLEKGDIVTHCFNGKDNSILNMNNKVRSCAINARKKGVLFDLGHGRASFNFIIANHALKDNFKCDTISSDIYHGNREEGPVYDLATTMEKMMFVGYSLEEVIDKVTTQPAAMYSLNHKGSIKKGKDADFTIFKVVDSKKELKDSNDNMAICKKNIIPKYAIVAGKVYEAGDDNEDSKSSKSN